MTTSDHPNLTTVLRLLGDGVLVSPDGLRPAVAALPLEPGHHVVVDASYLDVVGPHGLEVLASLLRRVDLVRGTLEVRSPSAQVRRLLRGSRARRHGSLSA
jgi:anti-anti-sigma regulatory factor